MTETVNVAELKDRLSELLAVVEKGGEVIVCRRNKPLARMESIQKSKAKRACNPVVGCMKGTVKLLGDLNEPGLLEKDWEMLK